MVVALGLDSPGGGCYKIRRQHSEQVKKRSHEAAQGQVHKNTQEVEERSRWRWSPRIIGVHRNQDRFIPSRKGARPFRRAPFPCSLLGVAERICPSSAPWLCRVSMVI